ncbi:MAG: DUF3343 domain-containing protein [Hungatella sp.]
MRIKEERLVITFHTTTEAMAAEQAFRLAGIPGRLIPVPRQISAGCGLAWSAPAEYGEIVQSYLEQQKLTWEEMGIYLC